jgi:hypothetical protein
MKNIQFIEPAMNCDFAIHAVSDEDFSLVFPGQDQDIEFVDDLAKRVGKGQIGALIQRLTSRESRIPKREVVGIHGTLFLNFPERKRFFPNKRDNDLDLPFPGGGWSRPQS